MKAYTGGKQEKVYKKKKVVTQVIDKGCRHKPLTEGQNDSNKERFKKRVRVKNIFGFIENSSCINSK